MNTFGTRLKSARERAGLSQVALGELAHITGPSISLYENGLSEPSLSNALQLASALGVALAELTGEQSEYVQVPYQLYMAVRKDVE